MRKEPLRQISYLGVVVDADDEAVIDVESTLCEFENWYAKVMKGVGEEDAVVQLKVSFPIQLTPLPRMSPSPEVSYSRIEMIHGS